MAVHIIQKESSKEMQALHNLEGLLYPTEIQPLDHQPGVIMVSIDIEYDLSKNTIDQIGLATLVSSALHDNITSDAGTSKPLINSHLFLLKRRYIPRNTYTRQYLYGTAEPITAAELSPSLAAILTPLDNSRIILVGHGVKADIEMLKRYCGLDLNALPSVMATIDTAWIPSYIFDFNRKQVTLKQACRLSGFLARQLHNAGNDAYYTLKVLILLFRLHKQREVLHNSDLDNGSRITWERRLEILERIGKENAVVRRPPRRIRYPKLRLTQSYDEDEDYFGLAAVDMFGEGQ